MTGRIDQGCTERTSTSRGRRHASIYYAPLALALGCDAELVPGPIGTPVYLQEQPAPIDDGNDLAAYVAQCEAVLGPIPEISCDPANPAPGTHVTRIPVLVDGLPLGFGDGHESDAILAARSEAGDQSCDFPSIGGDFPCTVGSTLVQYSDPANPNVQWVGLCRGVDHDNVGYDRFIGNGLIGANQQTGEMCFFFGRNPEPDAPYELPRLSSEAASGDALAPWLPPREMPGSCLSCHPNNDPWVLTPWLQPNYMRQLLTNPAYPLQLPAGVEVDDLLAARYIRQTPSANSTMLPTPLPAGRTAWTEEEIFDEAGALAIRQYRAVGSSYVANEAAGTVMPRTGTKPESWNINFRERLLLEPQESSCSVGCHAMANENFTRMAHDSLGTKYAEPYLSDLMGAELVPGFNWMPPIFGPVEPWRQRFDAAQGPSIPAITECPIPKQLDGEPEVEIACDGDLGGSVTVRWTYVNDFGEVPERDDVRFDVAVAHAANDAPDPRGISRAADLEGVQMHADVDDGLVIRDVAANDGSGYEVVIPFTGPQARWSVDLQPKRFCFEEPDRRPHAYAPPHHVDIDLLAACG